MAPALEWRPLLGWRGGHLLCSRGWRLSGGQWHGSLLYHSRLLCIDLASGPSPCQAARAPADRLAPAGFVDQTFAHTHADGGTLSQEAQSELRSRGHDLGGYAGQEPGQTTNADWGDPVPRSPERTEEPRPRSGWIGRPTSRASE